MIISWIKHVFKEMVEQIWTLLGMFIAWCVLDGSAKSVVGTAIMFTTVIWIIYSGIQERKEDLEDETNS